MSSLEYKLFYRRNLPHIQPPGATIFVTYRLVGSLPKDVIEKLIREAEEFERGVDKMPASTNKRPIIYQEQKRMFAKWDKSLDQASFGPTWLKNPRVAPIIATHLHELNGKAYDLIAYCIMSNHVHIIITPLKNEDGSYIALSKIMQSLKGYSAYQANEVLRRKGQFWQSESYDHFVRDAAELQRIVAYVLNNPILTGLTQEQKEWKWSFCKYW